MPLMPTDPGFATADMLMAQRAARGERPFLVWSPFDDEPQVISYDSFVTLVARCAAGLASRGIRRGDRVLVHLENCPETLIARFACAWLGAICVGTNALAAGPELAHYVATSGAKAAITQPKFVSVLAASAPSLEWFVVTDNDGGRFDAGGRSFGADSFGDLMAAPPMEATPVLASDICSIMFTSGTTSLPKGVAWTQANMVWAARCGAQQFGLRADDVTLLMLPLFHVVGLSWTLLPALWSGSCVVLQPRFSASRFWPVALEQGATLSTHVLFTTMALAKSETPPVHQFRQWTVGRADPQLQGKMNVPSFVPAWGMTEMVTSPIIGDPWQPSRPLSLGRASPLYDVRVTDDDGKEVEAGQSGHLLVRGRRGVSVFESYYQNTTATDAAFDSDGYFRTGDMVALHEQGFLQFADRASDVIKVGGEGLSPTEIEAVIRRIAGVAEVAVVGKPDDTYGQVPVAFVELKAEVATEVHSAIVAACQASLAKFKQPREIVFVETLPRVGNGKISRAALRRQYQAR